MGDVRVTGDVAGVGRATSGAPAAEQPTSEWQPYPASPFDRVIDGIASLPAGGWWVYPLLVVALAAIAEGYRWLVLGVPVGQVKGADLAFVVYGPYFLALAQYLDGTAERALDRFRPALDRSDADIERMRHELSTLPRRPMVLAFVSGSMFGLLTALLVPPEVVAVYFPGPREQTLVLIGAMAILSFGITATILYHTAHQLRTVARIHAEAHRLDLYRPAPLYAFSRLTARTGIGYAAIAYFSFLWNTVGGVFILVADAALVVAAAACFVLPLVGIHNRLSAERARLVADADERLSTARGLLYRQVDSGELVDMDQLDHMIAALSAVRDRTARLSTWPWEPAVLRGFVTALLLPVAIWALTRVLDRALPS